MKVFHTALIGLSTLSIAACTTEDGSLDNSAQSSSAMVIDTDQVTKNVIYRGLLEEAGASIFMQGSHKLALEDGRSILLESETIILSRYEGQEVEVFGTVRPTVEAGGTIMNVQSISNLEESSSSDGSTVYCGGIAGISCPGTMRCIDDPTDSCDPTSGGADCSGICVSDSSSSSLSSEEVVASASSASVRSIETQAASSSSLADTAEWEASSELQAKAQTMASADMSPARWTQEYCSTHVGFCIPIHKNWWYNSFGATASSFWHVEIGPSEINSIGDGPLTVQLVSGDSTLDGQVQTSGDVATGYKAWTGGRHIEIRGPLSLQAAISYITSNFRQIPVE